MKTILVVEDIKAIREALVFKLKKIGFDVLEAGDGKAGLKMALKENPDLIVCDLLMPVMDGFDMVNKLRTEGKYGKTVKVVILTNLNPDQEVYDKMPEPKPLYYFIKKDWSLQDLGEKIQEILGFSEELD